MHTLKKSNGTKMEPTSLTLPLNSWATVISTYPNFLYLESIRQRLKVTTKRFYIPIEDGLKRVVTMLSDQKLLKKNV